MLPFPFPWLCLCVFQKFSDDIAIKKSSQDLTNINSPFATAGTNMIITHMQGWAGRASKFRRRPEDFGLDARPDAQRKRWGDVLRPPPKIFVGRAPTYARRPESLDGGPSSTSRENVPRRPERICPDVQRKCVPTSREN